MIAAVFRAMMLSSLRDRGTLAMLFVLPPLIVVVFVSAFPTSDGTAFHVRLAAFDGVQSGTSGRIMTALVGEGSAIEAITRVSSVERVRDLVRRGTADIGLVLQKSSSSSHEDQEQPLVSLIADPTKLMVVPMITAAVERVIAGGETPPSLAATPGGPVLIERLDAGDGRSATAAYTASGVAILFLLFSAMHGAATLIDERASGTLERVLSGPGGAGPIVLGKFLFLVVQGMLQCGIIFGVAWAAYGVDLAGRPALWAGTTLAAASVSAGLALALAAICRTRQQIESSSTFLILVASAIGGSMAPRFAMPPWLQHLGWLTPNTWVIEAYQDGLWRDQPIEGLLRSWLVLGSVAVLSLVVATVFVGRRAA